MDTLNHKIKSFADRRASVVLFEDGESSSTRSPIPLNLDMGVTRPAPRIEKIMGSRPRGPPTPNMNTPAESDEAYSPTHSNHDPPPPPTPAASPGLDAQMRPDWSDAADEEDLFLSQMRHYFKHRSGPERTRILGDLLNLCTSQQLSFVSQYVSPLLKKDPFTSLPDELCLRVCYGRSKDHEIWLTIRRCYRLLMMGKYWRGHHRYPGDGGIYSATT